MREEWANNRDRKPVQSFLLVFIIVAAGLAIMFPLTVPKVKAQVTHLGSTSAEDSAGMPYDVTGPGDYIVSWDVNEDHILNADYIVESGWELRIPALDYMGDPVAQHEITVSQPINITVMPGGKLTFETDGVISPTKTTFLYNGSGFWDGIYFELGSEGVIQDVEIHGATKCITMSPGSKVGGSGILNSVFTDYTEYGLYFDGAVGNTNIHTNVNIIDSYVAGTSISVSNGMFNITDATLAGHGPNQANIRIGNGIVDVASTFLDGGGAPGYSLLVENSPAPNSTVVTGSYFMNGAAGNYYIECNGASPFIENGTFDEVGNALTVLANENATGVASHPTLRNPNPASSFDNTTINAVGNSSVSLQWWVDVYVKDGYNNAIPNAPVWVMDTYANPAQPYSKMTDATGWARWFLATELIQYDGWAVNFNPFNISAENNSIIGYADLENSTITSSRISIVVVGPFPLLNWKGSEHRAP